MRGLVILLLLTLAFGAAGYLLGSRGKESDAPTEPLVLAPSPSIITALRDVARLEGAVFHIERVVDLTEKQSHLAGLVRVEDAILLVAAGEVVAGVDLTGLVEMDVTVDQSRSRAELVLPKARVLSSHLDNERTYVHSRRTDALAIRRENLETRARQEAERTLTAAALEGGILGQAEKSVAQSVTALVRSLGFSEVDVRFRDKTQGSDLDASPRPPSQAPQ